jgi:hypothetical protein
MGEMMGAENGHGPEQIAQQDLAVTEPEGGVATDVEDVTANGEREGKPVFDVDHGEFYQNMEFGRKRLRFKSGSNIQRYMQNTRYNKPFFIRYKDDNGKEYIRRVK